MDEQKWVGSTNPSYLLNWFCGTSSRTYSHEHARKKRLLKKQFFEVGSINWENWGEDVARDEDTLKTLNFFYSSVDSDLTGDGMMIVVLENHEHQQTIVSLPSGHALALIREIVGNPYQVANLGREREPWLRWNDKAVYRIACQISEARDYDSLPFLADALEEAGCTNAEVLGHLRQPYKVLYAFAGATGRWGNHTTRQAAEEAMEACQDHFHSLANVRIDSPLHCEGCWVLDILTRKV